MIHWAFIPVAFIIGFIVCWGIIRIAASATKNGFFEWMSGGGD